MKYDLSNQYVNEYQKYHELYIKATFRTTTGNLSFTSTTSGTTYSSTTGEAGLFSQLQSILQPYMVTANDYNTVFNHIGTNGNAHSTATTSTNGFMSSSDKTKLNNITMNTTVDITPNGILNAVKTVDGTNSGLDADTLDGQHLSMVMPSGVIVMWSGSIASIPSGWVLCDGQNGTPDLRDRFTVGAGNEYAVGATGGSKTVNTSHPHSFSGTTGETTEFGSVSDGSYSSRSFSATYHRHPFSGTTANGGNTAQENRPPYYALAYIMKL